MLAVLPRARLKTDSLLLPVLERLRLIEVLHAVEHSRHHLASVLLIEVPLSDGVPQPLQPILLVPGDDLFVSASKIHCYLGPLEPMLERALRFHVSNIGLESLLLDSECLQNAKHNK